MAIIEWHVDDFLHTCAVAEPRQLCARFRLPTCVRSSGSVKAIKQTRATMNEFDFYDVIWRWRFLLWRAVKKSVYGKTCECVSLPLFVSACSLSSLFFLSLSLSLSLYHWQLCIWRADFNTRGSVVGSTNSGSECFIIISSSYTYLIATNGSYCFSATLTTLHNTLRQKCSSASKWTEKVIKKKNSNQCFVTIERYTLFIKRSIRCIHSWYTQKSLKQKTQQHGGWYWDLLITLYIFHPPKQNIHRILIPDILLFMIFWDFLQNNFIRWINVVEIVLHSKAIFCYSWLLEEYQSLQLQLPFVANYSRKRNEFVWIFCQRNGQAYSFESFAFLVDSFSVHCRGGNKEMNSCMICVKQKNLSRF